MKSIRFTLAFLIMLLFQLGDVVTTIIGLNIGFVEKNPWYNLYGLMYSIPCKIITIVVFFIISQIYFDKIIVKLSKNKKIHLKLDFDWILWGASAILFWPVISNLILITSKI